MEENLDIDLTKLDSNALASLWDDKLQPFLERLVIAVIIAFIGYLIIKLMVKFCKRTLARTKIDVIIQKYFIICVKTLGFVVLLLMVLSYLGVSVTSLIALISAAGVAVALALQNSLSNLAGGILIILTKPFSKGDLIDNLSVSGRVEEINLMNSKLHTLDNKIIVIPNSSLVGGTIINYSASGLRRVETTVSISYDDDLELAKGILTDIAMANPLILQEPKWVIGVKGHSANSVDIDFFVWCQTSDYWTVYYYVQEETLKQFTAQGITIPFPQMDVHLKQEMERPRRELE